jgi:DNA-binding NtrC family response regulator
MGLGRKISSSVCKGNEMARGQPLKVLIVDDDRDYVESLGEALIQRGWSVTGAHSGESALDMLSIGQDFDAVILDLLMPGMGGQAVLEGIRARSIDIPVVVLSFGLDMENMMAAFRGGAEHCLMKPCPVEELLSIIEDAAEEHSSATALKSAPPIDNDSWG